MLSLEIIKENRLDIPGRLYHFIFNRGHARSNRAKKNMTIALVAKGYGMFASLFMVPMTLGYLTRTEYGIWLTMTTVMTWMNLLDIGIVNGLRNRLSEALAREDRALAKTYVSTGFGLFLGISFLAGSALLAANHVLDWTKLFNAPGEMRGEIGFIMGFLGVTYCIYFTLNISSVVISAAQQAWIGSGFALVGTTLGLGGMWVLTRTTEGSFRNAVFVFSGLPVLTAVAMFIAVFKTRFKFLRPSLRDFDIRKVRDIGGLGIQFFFLQVLGMVIFSTANFILSQMFGPEEVVPYNIAFKYFSVVTLLGGILLGPLWPAYTEAFAKNDFPWIKHVLRKQHLLLVAAALFVGCMSLVSNQVFHVWTRGRVTVPMDVTLSIAAYTIAALWSSIYGTVLNGSGKIRLGVYVCPVIALVYVPLAIMLCKWAGPKGVAIGGCCILLITVLTSWIQLHKILSGTARGIWNK